jgi:hypothetical protein
MDNNFVSPETERHFCAKGAEKHALANESEHAPAVRLRWMPTSVTR